MTDNLKPIPPARGSYYVRGIPMPGIPPKARELTPEERAERKAASEQASAAAAAMHVKLLAEGVEAWLRQAREKWLRAGGYGFALTPEDEAAIRAAGYEPAPRDRPPK